MTTAVARYQLPHGALCVSKGNLVEFSGDAIVNAADTKCLYGKGVDGAVNKAGGPALIEARKQLPVRAETRDVRCPVGDAVITVGGNLRCRHVIHAVGPNFNPKAQWVQKVAPDGEEKLHSAYLSAMYRAKEHGVRTVAFSLLSAGFFRGPKPLVDLLSIACRAIREGAYPGLEEVHLVSFGGGEVGPLKQAAGRIGLTPAGGGGGDGGRSGSSGGGGSSSSDAEGLRRFLSSSGISAGCIVSSVGGTGDAAPAGSAEDAPIVLDDDDDEQSVLRKRARHPPPGDAAPPGGAGIERLTLRGGVLDETILGRVAAIAQQCNCVGCEGRGLADAIARKLPYGSSYADRRKAAANRFAVPEDRAMPGTIDVRRPPPAVVGGLRRPWVINLFAQWEMGAAGKYNRVPPPAGVVDTAAARKQWFRDGLAAIGRLTPTLASIAFPHQIGCGLAGGDWAAYEAMLEDFATAHPHIRCYICKLA